MKRIIGCFAALLLPSSICAEVTPTSAAPEHFKNWAVEPFGPFFSAYTANKAGAVFGLLCDGGGCSAYLNTLTECDEKGDYIAILNGGAGAFEVKLKCTIVPAGNDRRYLLLIDGSIPSAELDASQVGVAIPLADGGFGLHLFSTDGSQAAVARAVQLAGFKPGPPTQAKSK